MIENIWKLDWSPTGIEETFSLDTSRKVVGEIVPLKRTFFKGSGIRLTNPTGQALVVSSKDDRADILLYNEEHRLSELVGEPIYQSIRLNRNAVGTILAVTAVYVADQITSNSFNQELNQDAEVLHYSIDTYITSTREFYTNFARVDDRMELPNGFISRDGVSLRGDTMELGGFTLTPGRITSSASDIGLYGKDSHIRFDPKINAWVRKISSTNREAPLLSFLDTAIPSGGIPLANKGDPTTLTFVDWFKTDPERKTVVVSSLETKTHTTSLLDAQSIHIGGHTLSLDLNGQLNIDNALRIDLNTGVVTLGFVKLTPQKLAKLEQLLEDRR